MRCACASALAMTVLATVPPAASAFGAAPRTAAEQTLRQQPSTATTVSLTFDDGRLSQYRTRSTLAAHRVHATFFINAQNVDRAASNTMTWSQIHALAADGNDIGGHTLVHVNLTDPATSFRYKWHQVCADRSRLVAHGLNPQSFAYPYAAFDRQAERIVAGCGYQSGRSGGSLGTAGQPPAETVPPRDPMAVRVLETTTDGPITFASLEGAVRAAEAQGGGWVPMLFHDVCDPGGTDYAACMAGYRPVDLRVIDRLLGWIAHQPSGTVAVRDMTEVMGAGQPAPRVDVTSPTLAAIVGRRLTVAGRAGTTGVAPTVEVFAGRQSSGKPMLRLAADAVEPDGTWTAHATAPLPRGTYTVRAQQTRHDVTGHSPPVTFRTGAGLATPKVAVTSPLESSSTRAYTWPVRGTVASGPGDPAPVRLDVFAGSGTRGTPVSTSTVPVSGTTWRTTATVLAAGSYTLRASRQEADGEVVVGSLVHLRVGSGVKVTGLSPTALPLSSGEQPLSVTGSGFTRHTTVAFSGTGVAARVLAVDGPTSLRLGVTVRGVATTGRRDVLVHTPGRPDASCDRCFAVTPRPIPTSAAPVLRQGTRHIVRVTGHNFVRGLRVSISGGGVTSRVLARTATVVMLAVSVSRAATPGARELTVTNADGGTGTCAGCVGIRTGPPAHPAMTGG
ncbi:MAG: polysaccharide deacetylase family protein [Nocardioidaceae bacterium]